MQDRRISVVIVTKNRASDLQHCLVSLITQSQQPDEILIIDNMSTDETPTVISHIKRGTHTPVKIHRCAGGGYPHIYNIGLQRASFPWVAFLDDDCIANRFWIQQIKRTIGAHPDICVVLGHSKTQYPDNPYSLATFLFQEEWKEQNVLDDTIINFEILDNKNIVYNKTFLRKYHIMYDESRTHILNGAGEDSDLGMQIQEHRGKALYNRLMIVDHKDPLNGISYLRKYIRSFAAYEWFKEKWVTTPHTPVTTVHFRTLALSISEKQRYGLIKKIQYISILYSTAICSITCLLLFKVTQSKQWFYRIAMSL